MKKLLIPILSLFLIATSYASSMSVKRTAATITTSYVATTQIECADDHQVTCEVTVSGTPEAITASLVPQWSTDGTNWIDEPVNVAGTATATEQPYTRLSKRFDFSINSSGLVFTETFTRWGSNRYFRIKIKGGSASTTALVAVSLGTSKFTR